MKRVYRVMKAHGLLLERHTGTGEERRHDGRVAVDRPDPVVLGRVRDRLRQWRAGAHRLHPGLLRPRGDLVVATTGGSIEGGDIRDLMIESVDAASGW